ncbi:hypothetical protein, partial [Streptomyces sp. NPDC005096]|uniref:hypothetical protein n=1 Tax=Streptomyces sp. NPDC005096 TaxID=3154559 RepID=UPI0033A1D8E5
NGSSFGPRRGTDAPPVEVTQLLTINYWRRTLAADLQMAGVREASTGDGHKVNAPIRLMVIECTSSEGDVLVAAPPGQFEYVFMALNRT